MTESISTSLLNIKIYTFVLLFGRTPQLTSRLSTTMLSLRYARWQPRANWMRKLNASSLTPVASRSLSTAQTTRDDGRPFRVAVIGSGPAGFYTTYRVMSKIQNAKVDMYEALPVPFGLVRFGVAPDHPEVKVGIVHGPLGFLPRSSFQC